MVVFYRNGDDFLKFDATLYPKVEAVLNDLGVIKKQAYR